MNRKSQFLILLLIVAVSVVFGMVINSTINRVPKASAETPLFTTSYGSAVIQTPDFAEIAEKANPAVVSIDVKIKAEKSPMGNVPFDDFIWRFFGMPERKEMPDDRYHRFREKSPDEDFDLKENGGSGFAISSDGYILTNNHVVDKATQITVTMENDDEYEAKLIGSDPLLDVALIKIEPKGSLPVLPFGDSDALKVGEWVMAIGNPLLLKATVTVGVVSAKSRRSMSDTPLASFIQTDAAINFGNSGGPLLNAKGDVVGINTAIFRANYAEGIGFAIPINQVKRILDQLKTEGKVSHGYLGVGVRAVDENIKDYYGLQSKKGALIDTIEPGLPGDKAGLKKGDIILSVNGQEIKDNSDLVDEISSRSAGDRVEIGILRDGKRITIDAKLGERGDAEALRKEDIPKKQEKSESYDKFGFQVDDLTREYRYYFNLDEEARGVVVVNVRKMSGAWDKGIREGVMITEVNDRSVKSVSEFETETAKVKKGDVAKFRVILKDGTSYSVFVRAER